MKRLYESGYHISIAATEFTSSKKRWVPCAQGKAMEQPERMGEVKACSTKDKMGHPGGTSQALLCVLPLSQLWFSDLGVLSYKPAAAVLADLRTASWHCLYCLDLQSLI